MTPAVREPAEALEPPRMEPGTAAPSAGTVSAPAAREVSILEILTVFLRHWKLLVGIPLAAALLVGVTGLLAPRTWTATSTFVVSGAEDLGGGGLAGVAAQLGIRVPTSRRGQSPEFYVDLVRSPAILLPVAQGSYEVSVEGRRARRPLTEIFEAPGHDRAQQLEATVRALQVRVKPGSSRQTGVIRFSVTTRDPRLSAQLADTILRLTERFNLDARRTQAGAEKRFVSGLLAEARRELTDAENALAGFLSQNRQFESSPQLKASFDRLQRQVSIRQDVYTTLAQSYEQARIDEVRNTPAITVIDPPRAPAFPDPRRLVTRVILALVLGGLAALATAVLVEVTRRAAARDRRGMQELRTAARGVAQAVSLGTVGRRSARHDANGHPQHRDE